MTTEEYYMLLGAKDVEIYQLNQLIQNQQKTILDMQNAINQARQETNDRSRGQGISDDRLVDFHRKVESLNAPLGDVLGAESTAERLRQPSGTTSEDTHSG